MNFREYIDTGACVCKPIKGIPTRPDYRVSKNNYYPICKLRFSCGQNINVKRYRLNNLVFSDQTVITCILLLETGLASQDRSCISRQVLHLKTCLKTSFTVLCLRSVSSDKTQLILFSVFSVVEDIVFSYRK